MNPYCSGHRSETGNGYKCWSMACGVARHGNGGLFSTRKKWEKVQKLLVRELSKNPGGMDGLVFIEDHYRQEKFL